jgi:2-C-methyl-D-erythritol 4-phosphate cytidylyltransferase/2-C-methyl-D-erythritol 2,4-cyclodiphosphate synthase
VAAAVPGGETRALSVAAGLAQVAGDAEAILVHDAARPFASPELVDRLLAALGEHDGAIPALPVTDTVKRVRDGVVAETLDRGELRAVQTPQAFRAAALREAFSGSADAVRGATDCASLVEAAGFAVAAVAGDPGNLKITTPDDLTRAEARLA